LHQLLRKTAKIMNFASIRPIFVHKTEITLSIGKRLTPLLKKHKIINILLCHF
jgi:hypothetical protein